MCLFVLLRRTSWTQRSRSCCTKALTRLGQDWEQRTILSVDFSAPYKLCELQGIWDKCDTGRTEEETRQYMHDVVDRES